VRPWCVVDNDWTALVELGTMSDKGMTMKRRADVSLGLFCLLASVACSSSNAPSSDVEVPAAVGGNGSTGVPNGGGGAAGAAEGAVTGGGDVDVAPGVDTELDGPGLGDVGGGGAAAAGVPDGGSGDGVDNDGGVSGSGGQAGAGGAGGGAGAGGAGGVPSCSPPTPGSVGTNPLFTDQFTADPAPFVHDCTFYIHCGHDVAGPGQNAFVLREWFVLASTDMVNWTKNVAMQVTDFGWANANAWAGQVVTKDDRFYWYVPVQEASTGAMAIGVAVGDTPTGPFTDALGRPLINDAFEMQNVGFPTPGATPFTIDPTVFVDDDGQAYLHYGGFGRMLVARLNDDMISIDGAMEEETPQGFFEAPFLTKRGGTYYEIYAAGQNPATIDYATSNSPLGPWTRRGRILDTLNAAPGQQAPTSHPGVAEFAGQSYLVYHLSNGPNGGGTYRREVAVDKLNFNADGTIQPVTPSTGLRF
jgi:hypothetical protein